MEATESAPAAGAHVAEAKPAITYKRHGDKSIWGIFITLCIISVIELYSASSREVAAAGVYGPIMRHCFLLGMGVCIVLLLERLHYKAFFACAWVIAFLSMGMMLYVTLFGESVNGARRSFSHMGITIQPSEFIKLSAVLVIAQIMSKSQRPKAIGVRTQGVVLSAIMVLLFGGLLFKQGLTNTILLMSISMAMIAIGGTELKKMLCVGLVYAVIGGGVVFAKFMSEGDSKAKGDEIATTEQALTTDKRHGTWQARLDRFFSDVPKYEEEITAKNRQEMYSYMAQANGGVFGVFPGNSRETARLPLAFSDYIFSIIIEDLGFVGGVGLLILYLWLLARAGIIAKKCHRAFPVLLVMGMAVMIVLQALFHMAITTGTFPVSGQPLPLISKGGTSIIVTSIAIGAMLSVSRTAVQNGNRQEVKEELNALPEELRAENPVQL